jgi:hypothetical protein
MTHKTASPSRFHLPIMTIPSRFFLLAFALVTCSSPPAMAQEPLRVEAGETYVELWPADGFLFVREYYLSTPETDSARIAAQAAGLAERVTGRRYCVDRFGFDLFTSMEERMYIDRGFVVVECRLLTRERGLRPLGDGAFGRVLGRPVRLSVEGDGIRLDFTGADVQVRGNNAREVIGRGEDQAVIWRNGIRSYQVVFGPASREKSSFRSLAPYVTRDVASPEVSLEEIEAWRREP